MQNDPNDYKQQDWQLQNEQLNVPPSATKQLDKGQKIAVAVLAFFALGVIFIFITQTRNSLVGDKRAASGNNSEASSCADGNCGGESAVDLRTKDTDKDGLNDYDELNVHGTSPYIEDSDSDGYSDSQELKSGNDPNCPVGQTCSAISEAENDTDPNKEADALSDQIQKADESYEKTMGANGAVNTNSAQTSPTTPITDSSQGGASAIQSAQSILDGQGDPASLRKMLLETGMDPVVLNQISDQELMDTYNKTLAGQQ